LISGAFVLIYTVVLAAVLIYVLVLLSRMAKAQERTADAVDAIARRYFATADPPAPIPPESSMSGVRAGEFRL
jgi:hypothetical protein